MTDAELEAENERLRWHIRRARQHIGRGLLMIPDDDEGLASEIYAKAVNHVDKELVQALRSIQP